jgi:endogenous inhibitor of DNA gyrase (YacG/DUF329 family)
MPVKIRCPTCRKETEWENNPYRPFCSDRCQLIDLGAWIDERYRIPQESDELPGDDDDDDEQERR